MRTYATQSHPLRKFDCPLKETPSCMKDYFTSLLRIQSTLFSSIQGVVWLLPSSINSTLGAPIPFFRSMRVSSSSLFRSRISFTQDLFPFFFVLFVAEEREIKTRRKYLLVCSKTWNESRLFHTTVVRCRQKSPSFIQSDFEKWNLASGLKKMDLASRPNYSIAVSSLLRAQHRRTSENRSRLMNKYRQRIDKSAQLTLAK